MKIVTLLGLVYFGGALGALLGMYVFPAQNTEELLLHRCAAHAYYAAGDSGWYAMNWAW